MISKSALAIALAIVLINVGSLASPPPYDYMSPPPPSPSPLPPPLLSPPPPPPPSLSPLPPPSLSPLPPASPSPSPPPPPPPSPSPPPPPPIKSPPPPPFDPWIVRVVGKVYCCRCYDWNDPGKSHHKKPLIGATVEVACKAEEKTIKAFGKTMSNGWYIIILEDFDYFKYGPTMCEAKLHAPPKESSCNIPTNLNEGTCLRMKHKDKYEVLLEAKLYAYANNKPYEECEKSPPPDPSPSPPPYAYISPPLLDMNSASTPETEAAISSENCSNIPARELG